MQYKKTFNVKANVETALAYIADFRTLTEWEPSVQTATQTHGQGPGSGARYDIRMSLFGSESTMQYQCTEYASAYAILEGAGDGFTAYDRIDVRATDSGSEVTYFTDIRLLTSNGRMLEPVISVIFGFNVRHAVKNLRARLNA